MYQPKFIGGADVMVDDVSGALLVADPNVLAAMNGSGLTLARTVITQGGAGTLALQAASVGKIARLHSITFVADAAGTWQLQDTDGTALTGVMPITQYGGVDIDRGILAAAAIVASASGEGIQIVSVTSKLFGVALVSLS